MPDRDAPMALPFGGVRVLDLAAPGERVLRGGCSPATAPTSCGSSVRGARRRAGPTRPGRRGSTPGTRPAAAASTLDVADERARPLLAELAATVDVVIASPTAATPVAGFVADPLGLELVRRRRP